MEILGKYEITFLSLPALTTTTSSSIPESTCLHKMERKKNTLNVLRNISMSKQYVHYYCYLQAWCCYSCYFVAIPSRIFIYVHIFRRKQKEKFFKEIFLWRNQRAIMLSYLLLCLRLVCRGTSIIEFQIAPKQQNFLSLNKKKLFCAFLFYY